MRWTFNSACISLLFFSVWTWNFCWLRVQGAKTNKYVPFLQEEIQLRQRQRQRPRTYFPDTTVKQRQADRWASQQFLDAEYGKRTLSDYVKHIAGGDGLNVNWSHNVNSRHALMRALSGGSLNGQLTILEGDVFLKRQSGYVPMMLIPPSIDDAMKFKDWLVNVSQSDKTVKVNLRTTEVIKPALQYLFTVRDRFRAPLILHSNIGFMPGSLDVPADAGVFTTEIQNAMPDATIGVGWADAIMPTPEDDSVPPITKYTWRILFNMLEYAYELKQPIIFSCRAIYATLSTYELLWLLSVRDDFLLNIFASEKETVSDWTGAVALRVYGPRDRIIYDFTPAQKQAFMEAFDRTHDTIDFEPSTFDKSAWRVIKFPNPTALLSTIVAGSRGAAFVGWPNAILLSQVYAKSGRTQTVAGRLLFVKKHSERTFAADECGLAIFLLNSVEDIPSPVIKGGIRAFVGSTGRVSLQNRQERRHSRRHKHKHRNDTKSEWDSDNGTPYAHISPTRSDGPLTASRLPAHECYGFRLFDELRRIRLVVFVTRCSGGVSPIPKQSWSRTITLNVPRPENGHSRYVVVQKTGDASMDLLVENLYHRNCADKTFASIWRHANVIFISQLLFYTLYR